MMTRSGVKSIALPVPSSVNFIVLGIKRSELAVDFGGERRVGMLFEEWKKLALLAANVPLQKIAGFEKNFGKRGIIRKPRHECAQPRMIREQLVDQRGALRDVGAHRRKQDLFFGFKVAVEALLEKRLEFLRALF